MSNPFLEQLIASNITDRASLSLYASGARDKADCPMLACKRTGAIFAQDISHMTNEHYQEKPFADVEQHFSGGVIDKMDLDRRAALLNSYVPGKRWLDFGCGFGEILKAAGPFAASTAATELNRTQSNSVRAAGFDVRDDVAEFGRADFEVVTLFHVLEHLPDPVAMLAHIKRHCSPGATIIVEVPHARDFLLMGLQSDDFKRSTLWSEHLVLHTRSTLSLAIEGAGLQLAAITGIQRYPVANHLYWARFGLPGGHEHLSQLNTPELGRAYEAALARVDQTDTLLAIAAVP
ncbi:class I SAM-dependent methyltransferase [Devosia sp.]|uniref:class I SAM-dependent methyltransferase n=1 Tax=Devosia sp. TaxID=1871048 RepID=UPI0032652883